MTTFLFYLTSNFKSKGPPCKTLQTLQKNPLLTLQLNLGRFGGGFVIVCFFFRLDDDDEEDNDRCDFLSFLTAQTLVGFVELAFDAIFSDDFITLHKTFSF